MAVVLITGASSPVGQRVALELARGGHTVYAGMRDLTRAGTLERWAAAEGLGLEFAELDVLDERSVRRALERLADERGRLDACVSTQGVELQGAVHLVSDEEARWQFEHDVLGLMRVVRHAVPVMRRSGDGGVLVALTSMAGVVTPPYGGVHAAAEHAVEALCEAMRFELRPLGIRVAVVEPARLAGYQEGVRVAEHQEMGTPEHERASHFAEALRRVAERPGGPGRPDADLVARAVVMAIESPRPFRHVVGEDAARVAGLRASRSFEEYEEEMRRALDWWE